MIPKYLNNIKQCFYYFFNMYYIFNGEGQIVYGPLEEPLGAFKNCRPGMYQYDLLDPYGFNWAICDKSKAFNSWKWINDFDKDKLIPPHIRALILLL